MSARGVERVTKRPRRPPRDKVAEAKLAELEAALEAAVGRAIEAKDTAELLRLRAHFLGRVREATRSEGVEPDEDTPAADEAVALG